MSNKDILKLNDRVLRDPSDKKFKEKDFDRKVSDLENSQEVIETIKGRLRQAADFKDPFDDLNRRATLAYFQTLDTKKENSWESKRQIPLILQQMETATPILFNSLFNGPHIWQFSGLTPEGRSAAEAMDKLCHWQATGPSKLKREVEDMLFFTLLTGTGILDTGWSNKTEYQWVPKVVQDVDAETGEPLENEDGTPKLEKILRKEKVTVTDWPRVRCINPANIWLAPHGNRGSDIPWAIERIETTVGELVDAAGHGHVDKEAVDEWMESFSGDTAEMDAEDLFDGAETGIWDELLADVGYDDRQYNDSEDKHDRDKVVFLLEYRSKTERITIAPGGIIIGYSENPYIHGKTGYLIHHFIPIPGSPLGRGLATILLGHQELCNENINLFMDTARISLMAPIIVNRASMNPLDSNTVWTPNKILHARDVNNAAKRLDVPAPTNLAFSLDQHIKADAQLTTGFSEQSAGVASSQVSTATEASALQANLAVRTIMHVIRLKDTLTELGEIWVQLNQQFMTEEQMVAVVGEDGLDYHKIKPWQIVGKMSVQCVASASRANPAMRAQQLISALQVFLPILQQGGITPTIGRLLRTLLKTIEIEDVDMILPKEALTVRSPTKEHIALDNGVPVKPTEFENFDEHLQAHSIRRSEIAAENPNDPRLPYYDKHIAETAAMAQEAMGQGAAAQGPQADQLGGDRPGGQEATGLAAAQGSQGIPGASAPGPGAPPGRPM